MYVYVYIYLTPSTLLTYGSFILRIYGEDIFMMYVHPYEQQISFFHDIPCSVTFSVFLLQYICPKWKHWSYVSLAQKSAYWKTFCFFVSFIIYMRIVNTLCISKERSVRHYVDLNGKVFEKNSEIVQYGEILIARRPRVWCAQTKIGGGRNPKFSLLRTS